MCIVYVKKNATILINYAPLFDKKRATLLWFASGFVQEAYCGAFCQTCRNSAKRAAFSREKRCNPWKSATILGLQRLTRRHTFRNSVKVWRIQRDKCGARYAALISADAARLLHSFLCIPMYVCACMCVSVCV